MKINTHLLTYPHNYYWQTYFLKEKLVSFFFIVCINLLIGFSQNLDLKKLNKQYDILSYFSNIKLKYLNHSQLMAEATLGAENC